MLAQMTKSAKIIKKQFTTTDQLTIIYWIVGLQIKLTKNNDHSNKNS